MIFQFENPWVLLLLLILPFIIRVGWPVSGTAHKREALSLLFRVMMCVCLIFSLAGMNLMKTNDDLGVVFLLDKSDSVSQSAQNTSAEFIRQSLKNMKSNDEAAVVVFGRTSIIDRNMSGQKDFEDINSSVDSNQTDLASAIRLGSTLFQANSARRMVILSDGKETSGDSLAAARQVVENGIQVLSYSSENEPAPEVLIKSLHVPDHLYEGEHYDLQITLEANEINNTNLKIFINDQIIFNKQITVQKGNQTFTLALKADKAGFTRFNAQIDPQTDHFYQNNSYAAYSLIQGIPKILVVDTPVGWTDQMTGTVRAQEASALIKALQGEKLSVEQTTPSAIPADLAKLSTYSAVVLVDIPASLLNQQQMLTLQNYVRYGGGGLVVVGGPSSLGPGGYGGTPLEEILPVNTGVKTQVTPKTNAYIFIVDRSGSMAETSGGISKLDLAKEIINQTLGKLESSDRIGVIAFDNQASWVVPMTEGSNLQNIQNAVSNLTSGGETNIYNGIEEVGKILAADAASNKQIILLTDGASNDKGLTDLVQKIHSENGIVVTTIGLGNESGAFLKSLADIGKGHYYQTVDLKSIPSVFNVEVKNDKTPVLDEHTFTPVVKATSPILSGIETNSLPSLLGYDITTPKQEAQQILLSDNNEPILSAWSYGMGRSIVFTSDASERWAKDWLDWDSFNRFWTQLIQYSIQDQNASMLSLDVNQNGTLADFSIDAQAGRGKFLNAYKMHSSINAPDQQNQIVDPIQTAPGFYTGQFKSGQEGVYLIHISGSNPQDSNQPIVNGTFGWVVPYSPEYLIDQSSQNLLEKISALNHQAVRSLDSDPTLVFNHDISGGEMSYPLWPWLLSLAVLLLTLDITTRRLLIRLRDYQENFRRLKKKWFTYTSGLTISQHSLRALSFVQIKQKNREKYINWKLSLRKIGQPTNTQPIRAPKTAPQNDKPPQTGLASFRKLANQKREKVKKD